MSSTQTARFIIASLCLCLSSAGLLAQTKAPAEDTSRLLPEVAEIILNLKEPKPEDLKQNVYAGMLAIHAPKDMNPVDIGVKIIMNNFARHKKAIRTQKADTSPAIYAYEEAYYESKKPLEENLKIGEHFYTYTCRPLDANNCIAQILEQKEQILTLLNKGDNPVIMQRYLAIRQLPQYKNYLLSLEDHLPPYQIYTRFSGLRLSQAVITINKGDIDQGFETLNEEMAFAKRVLREDHSLIGTMISVTMLFDHYHTISELMDTQQMQPFLQDPRLLKLLTPLTEEEQTAIAKAFETERNLGLYYIYTLTEDAYNRITEYNELSFNIFAKIFFLTSFDRYATVNIAYQSFQPIIDRANLTMDEVADLKTKNKLEDINESIEKVLQKQTAFEEENRKNNPNIRSNYIGNSLMEYYYAASWAEYPPRFYDVQSYIMLVNTKHQIISKGLKESEIDEYLKQAGKTAQNPITREPFTWNAKEGTLSTPWLAKSPPVGGRSDKCDMPRNAVYLKLIK